MGLHLNSVRWCPHGQAVQRKVAQSTQSTLEEKCLERGGRVAAILDEAASLKPLVRHGN